MYLRYLREYFSSTFKVGFSVRGFLLDFDGKSSLDILFKDRYRKHVFPKQYQKLDKERLKQIYETFENNYKEINFRLQNNPKDKKVLLFWNLLKRYYTVLRCHKILDTRAIATEFTIEYSKKEVVNRVLSKCKQVNRGSFIKLWNCIDEVSKEFGLNSKYIEVHMDIGTNSRYPEIGQYYDVFLFIPYKSHIVLILNRNLVQLSNSNYEKLKVLMFHEFSHIIQYDSTLFARNELLKSGTLRRNTFFVILLFLFFAGFLGYAFVSGLSTQNLIKLGLKYLFPLLIAIGVSLRYKEIRSSKKISHLNEFLADVGAVSTSKDLQIIDELRSNSIKSEEEDNHPSPEKRIENILAVLAYCYYHTFEKAKIVR